MVGLGLLPFTLLQLLLRSHWKTQRAKEPKANITFPREYSCPHSYKLLLALTLEQLGFLPPLGEAAGNAGVVLAE